MLKIYKSTYIPPYVPADLIWYERDSLMTYIDRLNYERFKEDQDAYLKNVEVIYFNIIYNQIRGDPHNKRI